MVKRREFQLSLSLLLTAIKWLAFFVTLLSIKAFGDSPPLNSSEHKIEVKSEIYADEEKEIFLSDLIDVEGMNEKDRKVFAEFVVGNSPQFGTSQTFTNHYVSGLLRKALSKFEEADRKRFVVKIPEKVIIRTIGAPLNSKSVENKLMKQWEAICSDCKFVMMNLTLPPIPHGLKGLPWDIKMGETLPRGQFTLPFEISTPTSERRLFWVKGQVQVQKQVPVTRRAMVFGERVAEADFEYQWRDVTFAYDTPPTNDELVGRKVNRSLKQGEILLSGRLEKERALRRGDRVRVTYIEDDWSVSLNGVAEEDGFIGDRVKVRNDKTQKQMTGVVTGDGEVVLK